MASAFIPDLKEPIAVKFLAMAIFLLLLLNPLVLPESLVL